MRLWACLGLLAGAGALAQPAPRAHAGYLLPDGAIRVVGSAGMQGVVEKLDAAFAAKHPGLRFQYVPSDYYGAIDALIFDATPFAPLGTIYGGGIAYSDIVKAPPFSVRIAHGSLMAGAKVSPLAVIVNPANPVDKVSMGELAAMLSKPLRTPVVTDWRQVGVMSGASHVEPAGLPWSDHYRSEDRAFGDDVFYRKFAGAAPVDDYRMFDTYAEVVQFVAQRPGAIGVVEVNSVTPAVKVVGLVDGPFGAVHLPTAEGVRGGRYPLDRYLYVNARVLTGKPMEPLVREYLRFALSAEGQALIAGEGEGYLPLNELELAEELSKMDEGGKP